MKHDVTIKANALSPEQVQRLIDSLVTPNSKITIRNNKRKSPLYLDLRLMRNALEGLSETDTKYTVKDLIDLAIEKNIVIQESSE